MNRLLPIAIVACIIGVLPAAGQTVVFDSRALPVDYYYTMASPGSAAAQRFTTSGSGPLTLSNLSIYGGVGFAGPWNPLVTIQESAGAALDSVPSGVIVGSWTSDIGVIPADTSGYFDFSGSIALQPNTTYWVVLDINWEDGGRRLGFNYGISGLSSGGGGAWLQGADYVSNVSLDGTWATGDWMPGPLQMTLTATASAIPEPSTYAALAGTAMLGFAAWRRRRLARPLGRARA